MTTSSGDGQRVAAEQRLSPGRRLALVAMAAAGVSVVVHVGLPPLTRTRNPGTGELAEVGVLVRIGLGIFIGLAAVGIVLVAVLRTPDSLAVWVLGSPPAVMFGLLMASAVRIAGVESWSRQLDALKVTVFTVMDTAGVVAGFLLSAVATEVRFSRRLRLWLSLLALGIAVAAWRMVYLVEGGLFL